VADCPDDAALHRLRGKLYFLPIALDTPPGSGDPAGISCCSRLSHIVAEGVGVLRLMQSITRAYRGELDPPDPLPSAKARDLGSLLSPKTRSEKWARRLEGLRRIREALDPPSRAAVVGNRAQRFGFAVQCPAR